MPFLKEKLRWMMAGALTLTAPLAGAAVISYSTSLSGAAEAPPNASAGVGSAVVMFDDLTNLLTLDVTFSGLSGTTTAAHIHCCTPSAGTGTAGVATQTPNFAGFPTGVTAGTYHNVFDLGLASSWNSAFVTAQGGLSNAEAAFLAGLASGSAYLNIHTNVVPSGEIRGFLTSNVPEPAGITLLGLGACGAALARLRRRRHPA